MDKTAVYTNAMIRFGDRNQMIVAVEELSECHEEWCFETEEDVSLLNYRYCPSCGARLDGRC